MKSCKFVRDYVKGVMLNQRPTKGTNKKHTIEEFGCVPARCCASLRRMKKEISGTFEPAYVEEQLA